MKQTAFFIFLLSITYAYADVGVITEKYCKTHKKIFGREIDYKVSKGLFNNARGNLLKLTAHDFCLEAVKSSSSIEEFKTLFHLVDVDLCESTKLGLDSVLFEDLNGDDDELAFDAIDLIQEVDDICKAYQGERRTVIEFKVELQNTLGITI